MFSCYLDTSVILRVLFNQHKSYINWGKWKNAYTSELALVEGLRTIDRLRLSEGLSDLIVASKISGLQSIIKHLTQIKLDSLVLKEAARPMPTSLGTLDSIHLASAYLWSEEEGEPLVFVTHDRQLASAALSLNFNVEGV